MDWTPTNNCHWICSTDTLQGTRDQTGGFLNIAFCCVLKFFWSLEHRLQILHLCSLNATIPWSYTACWSYSKTVYSHRHTLQNWSVTYWFSISNLPDMLNLNARIKVRAPYIMPASWQSTAVLTRPNLEAKNKREILKAVLKEKKITRGVVVKNHHICLHVWFLIHISFTLYISILKTWRKKKKRT